MIFKPGDIVLVSGSSFFSKLIKKATRSKHESKTFISHVGIIDGEYEVNNAYLIEALGQTGKVERRRLVKHYNNLNFIVYRYAYTSDYSRKFIAFNAATFIDRNYGYAKIMAHFLDHCLGDAYIFRRLTRSEATPICSMIVEECYRDIGYKFPKCSTPDDIHDTVAADNSGFDVIYINHINGKVGK